MWPYNFHKIPTYHILFLANLEKIISTIQHINEKKNKNI